MADKIIFRGKQEIKGTVTSDNGKVAVIHLDAGGTMTVATEDIALVPVKTKRKRNAKADEESKQSGESEE